MKSSLMRARWAAVGAAVAVSLGAGAVMVASAANYPTADFTAITPCRLLDTRTDIVPVSTSKTENFGIRRGEVQSKAQGNTVNNDITVIFDAGAKQDGGQFSLLYDAGTSDIRPIMGACDAQFVANGAFDEDTGAGGLQTTVPTALLLNVTTVGSTANGFVTVYPWKVLGSTGVNTTGRPVYSNLNTIGNANVPTVSNNVTVALEAIDNSPLPFFIPNVRCDTTGGTSYGASDCSGLDAFRVYNENGNTHVIIDVLGYYS